MIWKSWLAPNWKSAQRRQGISASSKPLGLHKNHARSTTLVVSSGIAHRYLSCLSSISWLDLEVILIGHLVCFGPVHYEFLHRLLPILVPPLQQVQTAGRVFKVAKRVFTLDRPPELIGSLRVFHRPDEPLHVAVFVKIKLVRCVNEALTRVCYDCSRDFHLLFLSVRQFADGIFVALFQVAEQGPINRNGATVLEIDPGHALLAIKVEGVNEFRKLDWFHQLENSPERDSRQYPRT